jgi:hypothetical protein
MIAGRSNGTVLIPMRTEAGALDDDSAMQADMKHRLSQYEEELGRKQEQLAQITRAGQVRAEQCCNLWPLMPLVLFGA